MPIPGGPTKQIAFRLPETMVADLERCVANLAKADVITTRADVARLLLNHALDRADGDVMQLLKRPPTRRR